MDNRITKAMRFYNKANDLKYREYAYNGTKMISYAENIFEKYSIAVGNYLESDEDYSLGEVIRFLTLIYLLDDMNCLENKQNESVTEKFLEPGTRENELGNNVFRNSMYIMLKKPINKQSQFVLACKELSRKTRTGHIYWGVKTKRKENISEHIFGTCALAIALESEYGISNKIDMNKVLSMLAVHETEEIEIGDKTEFDTKAEEKLDIGSKAVHSLLKGYKKGKEIEDLLTEFNEKKTPESQFAYLCDKMEYILQVKKYEELGLYDFDNRPKNCCTESARVKELIESGSSTVFDVHANYDEPKYEKSPLFKKLLEYIRTHDLSSEESRDSILKLIQKR